MPVARIDPVALKSRLDAGEPLIILDVREAFERQIATIPLPASVVELTIPMNALTSRVHEITQIADGRPLVIYCHHGVRSMTAARWLDSQGILGLTNLDGGIDLWTDRVDPSTPRY
jgi:rhodanese-related sulfurtransferase